MRKMERGLGVKKEEIYRLIRKGWWSSACIPSSIQCAGSLHEFCSAQTSSHAWMWVSKCNEYSICFLVIFIVIPNRHSSPLIPSFESSCMPPFNSAAPLRCLPVALTCIWWLHEFMNSYYYTHRLIWSVALQDICNYACALSSFWNYLKPCARTDWHFMVFRWPLTI